MNKLTSLTLASLLLVPLAASHAAEKLKVLILDGQNNHSWKTTTPILKWILEDAGRFAVDVSTTPLAAPAAPRLPKEASAQQKEQYEQALARWKSDRELFESHRTDLWKDWHPQFERYDVVLSNYNGERWPADVEKAFVQYVRGGGGLVVLHAADNSFAGWSEYDEMIGVGWGRNQEAGPMIRWRNGAQVFDNPPGGSGYHGKATPYVVNIIVHDHPITQGLPAAWLHAKDELYGRLRGPCKNVTVLANALSTKETNGTGEIEPTLMTIRYGQGRVFHDVLGHDPKSMVDVGFQVTLARGTEWAATGKVTLSAPKAGDFSTDQVVEHRPPANP